MNFTLGTFPDPFINHPPVYMTVRRPSLWDVTRYQPMQIRLSNYLMIACLEMTAIMVLFGGVIA